MGWQWCLRQASKSIYGLVCLWRLTFCIQVVVTQLAPTIICAYQDLLKFVEHLLSYLAERDFCNIVRCRVTLNFDLLIPEVGRFMSLSLEPLVPICIKTGPFVFYRATRMHSADYAVARCLSVCLSHAGIVPKRLYISSKFFHRRVAPLF